MFRTRDPHVERSAADPYGAFLSAKQDAVATVPNAIELDADQGFVGAGAV
ncbi:MAG: hypothetical protein ACRDL8_23350 [Solirubrobacteraceae bacterium]